MEIERKQEEIILKKGFQYKMMKHFIILAVLAIVITGMIVYGIFSYQHKTIILSSLIATGITGLVIMSFLMALYCYRLSVSVYMLQKSMEEAKEGNFTTDFRVSTKNEFRDLVDSFNGMVIELRDKFTRTKSICNEVKDYIESIMKKSNISKEEYQIYKDLIGKIEKAKVELDSLKFA